MLFPWADTVCGLILFFLILITAQHQTRLVMRVVPMIDNNTALDNTATDTAGGDKRQCIVSNINELTFSRELS